MSFGINLQSIEGSPQKKQRIEKTYFDSENKIPDELIIKIFSLLEPEDLKAVAISCKRFYMLLPRSISLNIDSNYKTLEQLTWKDMAQFCKQCINYLKELPAVFVKTEYCIHPFYPLRKYDNLKEIDLSVSQPGSGEFSIDDFLELSINPYSYCTVWNTPPKEIKKNYKIKERYYLLYKHNKRIENLRSCLRLNVSGLDLSEDNPPMISGLFSSIKSSALNSIEPLPNITSLNLSYRIDVTEDQFQIFSTLFPNLKNLALNSVAILALPSYAQKACRAIAQLAEKCSLESLSLAKYLNDCSAFKHLNLSRLKKVNLSENYTFQEETLIKFIENHPTLESINLNYSARAVTDNALDAIDQLKNLKMVSIHNCNKVTAEKIESLKKNHKELQVHWMQI